MSNLFYKDISPDCLYCNNSVKKNNLVKCTKDKILSNGKCRFFIYNPYKRVPRRTPKMMSFSSQDFDIE
ncbi:MAG: hypothetical protein Q4B14_00360 [Clostridia bacterium]|nr:hypothetical protein [Clostridia bacterium]